MTVCIAAICELGIVGISDRMVTSGDIQYEHSASKITQLTPNVVAMMAGDASFQSEILQMLANVMANSLSLQENEPIQLSVKNIVDLYIDCRQSLEKRKIEIEVLNLFDLTYDGFLSKQHQLSEGFISSIENKIQNYQRYSIPFTETIIAGSDYKGYHIYTIENNKSYCNNQIGFTSIGGGARHASSQLMLSGYNPSCSISNALLSVHNAKKRSEVAPGVGDNTDMILIQESGNILIKEKIISDLNEIYKDIIKEERDIQLSAKIKVDSYIKNILEKNYEETIYQPK